MTDLVPVDAATSVRARAFELGRKEGHLQGARERARTHSQGAAPASFTAAARLIDLASKAEAATLMSSRARSGWMNEAWGYFDALPEVKAGARFKGRSLSKLRLYVGIQLDPSQEPVPLAALEEYPDADPVPLSVATAANDLMDRLAAGKGVDELLDRWGHNSFVVGESYLVGYKDETSPTGETFYMASPDELKLTARGEWALSMDPEEREEQWRLLPADTSMMVRIWNQHARYGALPDSSVRGVLDLCEILLAERNSELGDAFSRANNGMLIMPHSMVGYAPPVDDDAPEAGSAALRNPLVRDIYEHIMTPIGNPRSPSVAAPYIMTADADDIEKVRYLTFTTERGAPEKIVDLRQQLAQGVDLPEEILLGFGSATFSNSWIINDQTWTFYLQPDATQFVGAVTSGMFRPLLLAGGVPAEWASKLCVWYDKSALVGDPDESTNAFKAVGEGLIGFSAGRHRLGYAETEAPTEEDLALLMALRHKPDMAQVPGAEADGTAPPAEPAPAEDVAPADTEEPPAVTAAAITPKRLAALAKKWAARDRALMDRLLAMSDASMTRALDKAGAKLRTKAIRASAGHADAIRTVPNRDVATFLGPGVVTASLGYSTDELLAGSFDEVQSRYEQMVARAQYQTRRDLAALGLSEDDCDELEAQQDEDRHAGAALLVAGLATYAAARLFDPRPNAPALGEFDQSVLAPTAAIRQALSTAGGGKPASSSSTGKGGTVGDSATPGGTYRNPVTDAVSTGVTDGPSITGMLQQLHISTAGWVWVVGFPEHPFEPHQNLDGVEFTAWTAPELANEDSWPDGAFYFPGDHDGCQCSTEMILTEDGAGSGDLID